MAPHYGNNGMLSRDERVQLYGIDCEDQIVWHDWTPGDETVVDLVLQNVALVTQKVKFKLPPTREFDMPYPEPFKLAPGMKKSIPINFRPSKYEPHVDQIQIITKGGSFFVTVKALVKDIAITVPQHIEFGLCPTKEKSEMHVDVYNAGTLAAKLVWQTKPPFSVRAPADIIEVGEKMRCKVEFEPQGPMVFDGVCVLRASNPDEAGAATVASLDDDAMLGGGAGSKDLSGQKMYPMRVSGVGKMPHLCVPGSPRAEVDFGSVFPGNRVPHTLEIVNTTPVRGCFNVRMLVDSAEVQPLPPSPFSVSPESGVVEPHCSFQLTFYFQSHTVKEFACQRFRISTPGGTPLNVTCKAFCRPMEVRLSTRSVQFGEVACGKVYTRTLQLHNDSDRPALYHFVDMDAMRGVFWLDRHMGIIPPDSFMVVTLHFGPLAPSNYYRNVQCVVKGALAPISLSVLGSSYTEISRPAFLEQSHIDIFRNMQLDNIKEHPPPSEDNGKTGTDRLHGNEVEEEEEEEERAEVPVRPLSATHRFLETMLPMDSKLRDITLSPTDLDFGSCSTLSMSDRQTVTVTNRTSQKVNVVWMIVGDTRMPCVPDEKSLFAVYPQQCEVKGMSAQDFVVSFRPLSENNYEGGFLEAIVYQKVNRTFRLVDLKRFTPPWSLCIRGMGHTMGCTRNDPHLDISESHIRFRACAPGQRTYQVAMLTNPGDTNIAYKFLPPLDASGEDPRSSGEGALQELRSGVPFRTYPQQGIIEPHQFHLVILEFAPTFARNEVAFVSNIPVVVDYNEAYPKMLRVSGRCWEPKLRFCRGQSIVTFPASCSGIVSSVTCEVQNISEIPISYECRIPHRKRKHFSFPVPGGRQAPSEICELAAEFCPSDEGTYSAPMYCLARSLEDPEGVVEGPLRSLLPKLGAADPTPSYVLQFVGHGKGPMLTLDPESLDLGAVRACDEVKKSLSIINRSQLAVHFTVEVRYVGESEQAAAVAKQALKLEYDEGTVSSRVTETLRITFAPPCRGVFDYDIMIIPKGDSRSSSGIKFKLRADVQYPSVQIADLRTECATLQPQSMMWTQFQVDGINELYQGEVADVERRFQNAIGIDEKKRLVKLLKPFQLLFGTAAAGSSPTIVYLSLCNPSRLKVRFSFQTQKNLGLESVPYWCDEKALVDNREAHFTWVEEHGIYDIEPRSGEILPGDFLHVKMTYHHHSVGTHILPVVFNVHDGRSVLFYMKAHSVSPQVGCLSVRASVVQLEPVPLGVETGPVQPVELTNSGGVAAPWRIDLNSISEHNANNFDFELLKVTPVEGLLEAQSSTFLHFSFTPLEAKSYSLPVRIEMMKDGRPAEELVFEIRVNGYDPEDEKPKVTPYFPPNLPIQTYAPVPGCGAALSIEILDFDACPLRACVSRMLVLVNYTSEFVLSFRWHSRSLFRSASEFKIEPEFGELSPGSHCIIVFNLCCTEPLDLSGEVACMLEWTHLNAYGQIPEVKESDASRKVEYLAYHNQHIHEPMRTSKALASSQVPHISVANRLTVSRFRTLMSTAAGQKFLNENLHRTAVLASYIPALTQGAGRGTGQIMDHTAGGAAGVAGGGSQQVSFSEPNAGRALQAPPESPTNFPLYVRIRAVVADWAVEPERRKDFLVMGPSMRLEDQEGNWNDTRRKAAAPPVDDAAGQSQRTGGARSVLEHVLREVMAEDALREMMDNILLQETPFFAQFEDSAPPGEPSVSPLRFPVGADNMDVGDDLAYVPADESGSGDGLASLLSRPGAPASWRGASLLDFASPLEETEAGASSSSPSRPAAARVPSAGGSAPALGSAGSGTGALEAEAGEDSPQRYWDEALNNFGEVDTEMFRHSAGEVLNKLLLDVMEDVVAGRLNWMRPLPRARLRR